MALFPTNASQVQAFAGALYGLQVGSTTMTQVNKDIAAAGGLNPVLNAVYTLGYGSVPTASVATVVATNLGLSGQAATDGAAYITAILNQTAPASRGTAIQGILNLFAGLTADKTYGAAATAWNAKVEAATSNTSDADTTFGASVGLGKTFTLTTNTDNWVGSAANDTFSAPLADNGATNTILSSDSIDGGAGVDTLNATLSGVTNTLLMNNVTNVEKLNFTINSPAAGAGANTVNFLGATPYTDIAVTSVNANALNLLNLGKIPASVSINQTVAATDTIDFDAAALAGAADNLVINLPGSNAGSITVSDDGSNPLETITINSTGAANTVTTLTTTALGATKLVVKGDADLTITTVTDTNATLKTYDASALPSTAKLTIGGTAMIANATVTGGAGNDSITVSTVAGNDSLSGGAGNDTFTFGANLTTLDTVVGGDGTDTVSTAVAAVAGLTAGTAYTTISGVETLTISDATAANTVTTKFISSDINRVNLTTATGANNGTLALSSGAQTVAVTAAAATLAAGQTMTITSDGTGTTDSLTLSVSPSGTQAAQDYLGSATSNLTTTGFETVAINTGTFTTVAATTQNLGALNVGAANAITVTGSNTLGLAAGLVAGSLDASGMSGAAVLTMGGAPTAITSITGTARADTLVGDASASIDGGAGADTITGGSGNDTILGGDGNDSITANGGVDSILGGAGNDTIIATLASGNVINGGDGTDTLSLAAAATATTGAGVSGIETLTLTTTGLTQDMTLFVDNGLNTITRVNISGAISETFTNVGSATNTVGFTSTGTLTGFTRLVDTATDSLTLSVTDAAAVTSATANNENTITVTGATATAGVTVTTLVGTQMSTLNVGTANTSTGNFSIPTITAGSLANVTINTTGTANIGGTANSSNVNMIVTAGAGAATIQGGSGADSITGGGAADSLIGGSGNDTISGGAGADTITGGVGADRMTTGSSADQVTVATNSSVAFTTGTFAGANFAANDTIAFANGVDVVTDFTAGTGGDTLDVTTAATAPTAGIGIATGGAAGQNGVTYSFSGTWNDSTKLFTILATGTGADTLIMMGLNNANNTTNASWVVLTGVVDSNLVAGNFV